MNKHTEHLRSTLGGLSRRQVITAMHPDDMRKIFEDYARTTSKGAYQYYTIDQKIQTMELVKTLGFTGASRQSNVAPSTITEWTNTLCACTSANTKVPPQPKTTSTITCKKLPYLHQLCDAPAATQQFKQTVVLYCLEHGATAAVQVFKLKDSTVRNWVKIAETGTSYKQDSKARRWQAPPQPAPNPPLQYGLIDLSPLATKVQELEQENTDLKKRLAFIEKFSRCQRTQ